jgi:hypothetical protein
MGDRPVAVVASNKQSLPVNFFGLTCRRRTSAARAAAKSRPKWVPQADERVTRKTTYRCLRRLVHCVAAQGKWRLTLR